MMKLLLDAGANAKLRTTLDEDVLEFYSFWNDPHLVRMLLEQGIDPARKDGRGHNALLFAASSDTVMPEVFTMLLKGAPVTDARNAYGDGILQAKRRGSARLTELLSGTVPALELPRIRAVEVTPSQIRAAVTRSLEP